MVSRNKKGIRRITSDKELLDAFGVDEEADVDPQKKDPPELSPKQLPPLKKSSPSKKIRLDKNGFPILDKQGDLSTLMEADDETEELAENSKGDDEQEAISEKAPFKTRHGIQILSKETDYNSLFQKEKVSEDFGELVAESLGNKSISVLLKEKRDTVHPVRQLSEQQRLKRYPKPQGELDLHGLTAIKADLTVEAYLRNAYRNGTYTVRVIVGKGLHSKDGPVLPDIVEKRVLRLKKEKIVFAYEWEKKKKSKSGSLTVYLNNYSSV